MTQLEFQFPLGALSAQQVTIERCRAIDSRLRALLDSRESQPITGTFPAWTLSSMVQTPKWRK